MALGCGLTSVRGNRGENYENEPLVRQKHIKKKKVIVQSEGPGGLISCASFYCLFNFFLCEFLFKPVFKLFCIFGSSIV
jgi:hypothetical protein